MSFRRNSTTAPTIPVATKSVPTEADLAQTQPKLWAPNVSPQPSPYPATSARGGLFLLAGALLLLAMTVLVIVIIGALFYRSQRIMPGVQTMGFDLGGMSTVEATSALQTWRGSALTLNAGHTTQTVNPETLGLMLDAAATVQQAHRQGRSWATLVEWVKGRGQIDVPPVWRLDPGRAQANLQALAPQLELPPLEARIRIVGGRAEATPAISGQKVDVAASAARLEQNLAQVATSGRLDLVMTPVPPTITDVSAAVAEANYLLSQPLAMHAYDPITDQTSDWTVAPDEWGTWLELTVDATDSTKLNWRPEAAKVEAFLTAQGATLGEDRYLNLTEAVTAVSEALTAQDLTVHLRVYHHERKHTVQFGETLSSIAYDYGIPYPWIQQVNPGVDRLSPGQVLTIPSPDALLPLPVVEGKRIVVSISQQKMWAYEGGAVKWEWPVSTGISSSPTSPGVFQIQTHVLDAYAANWNLWMPHFMGIYRPVPTSDFMNGFHGFPTRGSSQLLWTGDLGHPVTYGCILVSSENAAALYEWAEEGVVVEIQR